MKKILVLIIFCSVLVNAQSVKLGFDAETNYLWTSNYFGNYTSSSYIAPTSFHLSLCFIPIDKISLYARIGGNIFFEDFTGSEYGFSGKYVFYSPFYFTIGYLYHYNLGGTGGNSSSSTYAEISLIQAGAGISAASFLSIEIDYYVPTAKRYISWVRREESFYYTSLDNLVRMSFIFDWKL